MSTGSSGCGKRSRWHDGAELIGFGVGSVQSFVNSAGAAKRRDRVTAQSLTKERTMAEDHYLEDFAVGQTFQGGSVKIDTEQIKVFASQYDPQPFHLDEKAAAATFFGGLVASGWHTAALTMRMIVDSDLKIAGGLIGAVRGAQVASAGAARRHAAHCVRGARSQAIQLCRNKE